VHDLNLPNLFYQRGHEDVRNHGANWLYKFWPGKKFPIGINDNNMAAIQLPSDKSALGSLGEKMFRLKFEYDVPPAEIELAKEVLKQFASS
jgi:hypothetical protein